MKTLLILIFSMVMAGEMTVDGNLTVADTLIVNNRDVITTIDSLLSLIAQLEMRIAQLECQNTGIIPDGYCDCFFNTLDECGECDGDTTSCQDCAGVPNGDSLQDMCGYCNNDPSNDCVQDCLGEWGGTAVEDACGECGGDAMLEDECCIDIDGNHYQTVVIGDQIWMAENLRVTHHTNEDDINELCYQDNADNCVIYGALYSWLAAQSDNICPENWHVANNEDWIELEMFLGISEEEANSFGSWRGTDEGGKLKSLDLWQSPNAGATNEYNFNATPAGFKNPNGGDYYDLGKSVHFWVRDSGNEIYRVLSYDKSRIGSWDEKNKDYRFSVRCIKD